MNLQTGRAVCISGEIDISDEDREMFLKLATDTRHRYLVYDESGIYEEVEEDVQSII